MRAHPVFGDTLIAGCLLLLDFPLSLGSEKYWLPYALIGLLLVGPLPFRRQQPFLTAYLVLAGATLQLLTVFALAGTYNNHAQVRVGDLALGIALYTLVAFGRPAQAWLYALALTIGLVGAGLAGIPVVLVFTGGTVLAFCWLLGGFVGARRAYHAEVEQRVRMLETERDQQARLAVADERARIARELHDVVAHAVSVIIVQADGAGYAIRTNPQLAEAAVKTIGETGREALGELRRLLGVLRSEQEPGGALAPQPDARALVELVEKIRTVGLPVELETRGDLDRLPAAVGLGLYRIVQEALTNTLKHAGVGARAVVRVAREDDRVELEVADDGYGKPREVVAVSGGNGLIGMRERASVFGGTLTAGPRPGGGWRVRATLPLADGV
ncbi:sensor histidine kinase [Goodfellowiella coeruleoviolacea]|uniref:histidine kinase n=1 Tax=Goodfellowiella coeruleoviolacea TaxID=334858 RepID=A0AAE3GDI9_9PSEU|nr:sensor histidine kinase [Goodfellowiella coeruleoviolacea]MCP2166231.1 Signal transduction histidine kinase [Goodfellowiella coeruleoviolacea]